MKFVVVKERETQRWHVVGPTEWRTEEYYPYTWSKRTEKRGVQKTYIYPSPETVSPFIEAHKVCLLYTSDAADE